MTQFAHSQPSGLFDLFGEIPQPVLASWGAGVDSTAMLIELISLGKPPDHVLFADTGSEKPETYTFIPIFMDWLEKHRVPVDIVRYEPQNFKNFPPYRTLDENCLTNGTLPSIAFGFGSCSQKWKIEPQRRWAASWEPAQRVWAAGGKIIKLIGYDASPRDQQRRQYAHREGLVEDDKYSYQYPLQAWGWSREDCAERIRKEGLPVPPKSACYMCTASKPWEIDALPVAQLRRIVLMEARAAPRLRTSEGLWRSTVKGTRGGMPRPGSMTTYIRQKGLLPATEIDRIIETAPKELLAFQEAMANVVLHKRSEFSQWLKLFDALDNMGGVDVVGQQPLFAATRGKTSVVSVPGLT